MQKIQIQRTGKSRSERLTVIKNEYDLYLEPRLVDWETCLKEKALQEKTIPLLKPLWDWVRGEIGSEPHCCVTKFEDGVVMNHLEESDYYLRLEGSFFGDLDDEENFKLNPALKGIIDEDAIDPYEPYFIPLSDQCFEDYEALRFDRGDLIVSVSAKYLLDNNWDYFWDRGVSDDRKIILGRNTPIAVFFMEIFMGEASSQSILIDLRSDQPKLHVYSDSRYDDFIDDIVCCKDGTVLVKQEGDFVRLQEDYSFGSDFSKAHEAEAKELISKSED